MSEEESDLDWEFDTRRFELCKNSLIPGEELVWYEPDARFDHIRPPGAVLKKTLRKLTGGDITFLVQDSKDKVLTVGTMTSVEEKPNGPEEVCEW